MNHLQMTETIVRITPLSVYCDWCIMRMFSIFNKSHLFSIFYLITTWSCVQSCRNDWHRIDDETMDVFQKKTRHLDLLLQGVQWWKIIMAAPIPVLSLHHIFYWGLLGDSVVFFIKTRSSALTQPKVQSTLPEHVLTSIYCTKATSVYSKSLNSTQANHTSASPPKVPLVILIIYVGFLVSAKRGLANISRWYFCSLSYRLCTISVASSINSSSFGASNPYIHLLLTNVMESSESPMETSRSLPCSLTGSANTRCW